MLQFVIKELIHSTWRETRIWLIFMLYVMQMQKNLAEITTEVNLFHNCIYKLERLIEFEHYNLEDYAFSLMVLILKYHYICSGDVFKQVDDAENQEERNSRIAPAKFLKNERQDTKKKYSTYLSRKSIQGLIADKFSVLPKML
jgi:hypothetical protein